MCCSDGGPLLGSPSQTRPSTVADHRTHLRSWSQRAWSELEDSTGNTMSGSPVTSHITSSLSTGRKQEDSKLTIPSQQDEGGEERSYCHSQGPARSARWPQSTCPPLPGSLPPLPQSAKSFPFSESPAYFQSSTQPTYFSPRFMALISSWLVFTLAGQPVPFSFPHPSCRRFRSQRCPSQIPIGLWHLPSQCTRCSRLPTYPSIVSTTL